jgi:hypothetical protein
MSAPAASGVVMGTTVGPRLVPSHPQVGGSPKVRATKLRDYATALECSEAVAEKKVYGHRAVNHETATVIEAMLQRGEIEDAAAFGAPITAALTGTPAPHWTDAMHDHNYRDAAEDVDQARWIRESSDAALELYIRSLATDIRYAERYLASLCRERDERRTK